MSETATLGLPLIAASQAQKHITHNEALARLDAIVQLAVKDRDLAAPPGAPAEGDRWIVAAAPTGAWAGQAGKVAGWQDGAWAFLAPKEGWLAWVADEDVALVHNGAGWVGLATAISVLQNLALLGIGTAADATNPFSAKLNKALWTARTAAEGGDGDLRYTLNKETAADVVSLLLQRGFSGRAEIGLIGDDDLRFKVSADGATWKDALRIDRTSGKLTHLGQLQFPAAQNASADPNCLDDYEEGSFTPTFSATVAPTGVTYANQQGAYVKVGRLVYIVGRLNLSSKGAGGSGLGYIGGLPFAAGQIGFSTDLRQSGLTLPAGSVGGFLVQSTILILQSNGSAGAGDVAYADVGGSADLIFSGTYSI